MKILLELTAVGVGEMSVIAESDEASVTAHKLLAAVAPQIRSLNAAARLHGSVKEEDNSNSK